jgi:hypothetical protein
VSDFSPPHDCRLTIGCLKRNFNEFKAQVGSPFETLRPENSVIDRFFERRQDDEEGGEGGERIQQVRSRPVFSLHSGRTRGATWFDKSKPPQAVVWLLGAELHDERHKGRTDAYDIFGQLDRSGKLFPTETDYKWLELDRRRLDTDNFQQDVLADADDLIARTQADGRAEGSLAGVAARAAWHEERDGTTILHVAISREPYTGSRSGYSFPLTDERFLLMSEAVRQRAEARYKPEVLAEEVQEFPGGTQNERVFVLVFDPNQ